MNNQTQEALKMAIEALKDANDTIASVWRRYRLYDEAINACKEALEQPAQEPVFWISEYQFKSADYFRKHSEKYEEFRVTNKATANCTLPLYTHPAQPLSIPQFPTMLRKMWSGSEVQKWIDENIKQAHGIGVKDE